MTKGEPPGLDRWLLFPGLVILAVIVVPGTMSDDPVMQALCWVGVVAVIAEIAVLVWRRRRHRTVDRDDD